MATFPGQIVADVAEARFAFSGKVAAVKKRVGDAVKKGELIASLDRKLLQTELDRQLSDYEKVRSEFEIFQKKSGQTDDDVEKFSKQGRQAQLDTAVKDVELAKYRMDQADLVSPVNGTILDLSGLSAGLYVTPSNSPVRIVSNDSLRFTFEVHQESILPFLSPVQVKVQIHNIGRECSGRTAAEAYGKDGIFTVHAFLDDVSGLISGLRGEAIT